MEEITGLKEEFIIESTTRTKSFSLISEAGYHTSYYLPTKFFTNALKENNSYELAKLAENIAAQVIRQQVHAVSFRENLHPFVENYLRRLLPDNVVFHTWQSNRDLFLTKNLFLKSLKGRPYYNDKRVETILVHYESLFHLM